MEFKCKTWQSSWSYDSQQYIYLPNGMTNTDSTTMDIDFVNVQTQDQIIGQNDHTERLVNLPHVDVFLLNTSVRQYLSW